MPSPGQDPATGVTGTSARTKLLVCTAAGAVAGAVAGVLGTGRAAPLIGWDVLALLFSAWDWAAIWPMDADATASHALREDPRRELADLVLLGAALASILAVGAVLFGASHLEGPARYLEAGLALISVSVSWIVIHTVFTLRYARLYYSGRVGGIDFNEADPPQYSDFAYIAFTIGMTFQVSDTDIQAKAIRRAALRHALLSFPMGVVIISTSINLVSGLAK
jgi:uncharacterized membrane protein